MPNRILGVVGEHKDFPVENLSKSHCARFLASCSHDQKVKFWNIEELPNEKVDTSKKAPRNKHRKLSAAIKKDDFFADLAENNEQENENDDDDDDDDDDEDDSSSDEDLDSDIEEEGELSEDERTDSDSDNNEDNPKTR